MKEKDLLKQRLTRRLIYLNGRCRESSELLIKYTGNFDDFACVEEYEEYMKAYHAYSYFSGSRNVIHGLLKDIEEVCE